MAAPVLDVLDVRKSYGTTVALDGVTFQVAAGEMFGLLGPNGAGKTTLLSVISGLVSPSGGMVQVLGRTASPSDREFRRDIGMVPQELAIYGELSARENIAFFGRLYGLADPELSHRVEEILTAVGLADRADGRVAAFSGGMKRRLNLGVALVHQPPLLLLDEPTTGVDPQSRNHLFEEIRRVNRVGTTVVYTSHYMEEVQALCRRVGILDHGRLIACDTVPRLLQRLNGLIRFRVSNEPPELRLRLRQLAGVHLVERDGQALELECPDVQGTLLRLLPLLNDLHLDLTSLETEEPNLERVFLHLTGRALRD
jgi:ABC-2 type transport system ATP-binding protein